MDFKTNNVNNIVLNISFNGNFDALAAQEATSILNDIIDNDFHPQIEIDFNHVKFLDSSGLNAMIYLHQRLVQAHRNMRLENVHGQPLMLMNLLHISQTISMNTVCHDYL